MSDNIQDILLGVLLIATVANAVVTLYVYRRHKG